METTKRVFVCWTIPFGLIGVYSSRENALAGYARAKRQAAEDASIDLGDPQITEEWIDEEPPVTTRKGR